MNSMFFVVVVIGNIINAFTFDQFNKQNKHKSIKTCPKVQVPYY